MTLINSDFERTRWMEARNTGAAIPAFSFVRVKEAITVTDATTGNGRLVLDLAIAGDDETAVTTEAANVFGFVGSMAIPVGTSSAPTYGLITLDSIAWALYDSGTGAPEPGQVWWPPTDNSGDLEYAGAGGNTGADDNSAAHNFRDAQFTVMGGVNSSETRMLVSRGGMDSFSMFQATFAGGPYSSTGSQTLTLTTPSGHTLLNGITEDAADSGSHWDYDTGTDTATCLYDGWWEYFGKCEISLSVPAGGAYVALPASPHAGSNAVVQLDGLSTGTIDLTLLNAANSGITTEGTYQAVAVGSTDRRTIAFGGLFAAKKAATATTFTVTLTVSSLSGTGTPTVEATKGHIAMRRLNV